MDKIITISRQYGSGGREIGAKLAAQLGIPFYDNELIVRAAKESGFSESIFENAEKKAHNSLLYSLAMGMNSYGTQDGGFAGLSLDDKAYLAQVKVINKVAVEGPCIIVGRCADYILRDRKNVTHIFICANPECRIKRIMEYEHILSDKAKDKMEKGDRARSNYYNYHTGQKWGRADLYDLSINSSSVSIEDSIETIKNFILAREEKLQ